MLLWYLGIFLFVSSTTATVHTLRYVQTVSSLAPGFVSVARFDGTVYAIYSARAISLELKTDWARAIDDRTPNNGKWLAERYGAWSGARRRYGVTLRRLMHAFDHHSGLHVLQDLIECSLDAETGKTEIRQRAAYDGIERGVFDPTARRWFAVDRRFNATAEQWNRGKGRSAAAEMLVENCAEWVALFLNATSGAAGRDPIASAQRTPDGRRVACQVGRINPSIEAVPELIWYRDDVRIAAPAIDEDQILSDGSGRRMVVALEPEDIGEYTCVVRHRRHPPSPASSGRTRAIAGGLIGAIISVGFVIGVAVVCRRRRQLQRTDSARVLVAVE